jgi:hypothetical protein
MNPAILIQVALDLTPDKGPQVLIFPFQPKVDPGETTLVWTRVGSVIFHFAELHPAGMFDDFIIDESLITAKYVNCGQPDHDYCLKVRYHGVLYHSGDPQITRAITAATGPTIKNG